jgi:hypothetical protein
MKRLPSSRLGAVTSSSRPNVFRTLMPLRALPKHRMCEDVYPGGFCSTLTGPLDPTPKVIPFPGTGTIATGVDQAFRGNGEGFSLSAMLFFAPPVDHFAAFGVFKQHPVERMP